MALWHSDLSHFPPLGMREWSSFSTIVEGYASEVFSTVGIEINVLIVELGLMNP
jgi:hypothetical protein